MLRCLALNMHQLVRHNLWHGYLSRNLSFSLLSVCLHCIVLILELKNRILKVCYKGRCSRCLKAPLSEMHLTYAVLSVQKLWSFFKRYFTGDTLPQWPVTGMPLTWRHYYIITILLPIAQPKSSFPPFSAHSQLELTLLNWTFDYLEKWWIWPKTKLSFIPIILMHGEWGVYYPF